ncbi:MAG: hypothetical protein B7Z15_10425 [Rhizobiales bacterium 32-66-8]|nr:MAG: hypothetical protein B7Z15_10425 [Rhizobiales bacterium 32-66-8]
MSDLIVDASVAVKWFVPEDESNEAERLFEKTVRLFAPTIILGEVANALWKVVRRGDMPREAGLEAVGELPGYFNLLFDTDTVLSAAFDMACDLDHPIYDCLYVESARRFDMPLLTADVRLIRKLAGTPYGGHVIPLAQWRP